MAEDQSWLGKLAGSGAEAKARLKQDAAERAAEARRQSSIILNQKDLVTGQWDFHKILFTTLDGKIRPITADDLAQFKYSIKQKQSLFRKGVTAKQVIDLSLDEDRKRAIQQITMSTPVAAKNGKVRFLTNAGPDSKVNRHNVIVEFLNYGAEAASGAADGRKSAMRMRKGPLKIECDCERWRYWYRYIATIGGFNAGRDETGFPKIRNPKLHGIACKHILRVMSEIESGASTLNFLVKLLDKAKSDDNAKAALRMAQKDAEKAVKNQAKRTTGANIKTSDQKRAERMAKAAQKAATSAKPPKRPRRESQPKTVDDAIKILAQSGLSQDQIMALIKAQTVGA